METVDFAPMLFTVIEAVAVNPGNVVAMASSVLVPGANSTFGTMNLPFTVFAGMPLIVMPVLTGPMTDPATSTMPLRRWTIIR